MGISEIFINKRKINKKGRGIQGPYLSCQIRALKMIPIESKDNALLPWSLICECDVKFRKFASLTEN